MRRVATVARLLVEQIPEFWEHWHVNPTAISFLGGLHDVGKISPGFQSRCRAWLEQNDLLEESVRNGWVNAERDHSKVSQFALQRLLMEPVFCMSRSSAIWWAAAIGSHHGRLHFPGERGLPEKPGMCIDKWEQERRDTALQLLRELNLGSRMATLLPDIDAESPVLWLIAGLISVADWIGSDENSFPVNRELTVEEILTYAACSIESIGLQTPEIRRGLSFPDLFPFPANSLQRASAEYIRTPGVYVIEAPMGMGKTEAALGCAYQLICSGNATGLYFALPTQATSNRIHIRLVDFVHRICPDAPSTKLIHSNSWLLDNIAQLEPSSTSNDIDDARRGRDWFASAKRALIAPFGVGTIDQALLSIVAAKHFFVRRFALARKVVIIDEVHSYDVYTGTLIGTLCAELEKLGCTIILLSATLTRSRRKTFVDPVSNLDEDDILEPYPLISGRPTNGQLLPPIEADGPQQKTVSIKFLGENEAVVQVLEQARGGACVLWICNTVARTQQVFRHILALGGGTVEMGLLHARFPHYRRMELEEHWMLALGKDGPRPPGCILVSTQIVEQSVDLDADLIITELAPTDMLLQRMGRLWRHERNNRPTNSPEYWIISENEPLEELQRMTSLSIKKILGTKARVYAPYVLLRTLEAWVGRQDVTLPDQIRNILKETYADHDDLPESWLELRNEIEGDGYARRMKAEMAANIFNPALPDEEGVQTRLNEMPVVSLILAKCFDGRSIKLINGDGCRLEGDEFRINDARALHRNLVRVPKWVFELFHRTEATARYVRGDQAIAVVEDDGLIKISGLKQGTRITWENVYGIEILQDKGEDNESCD